MDIDSMNRCFVKSPLLVVFREHQAVTDSQHFIVEYDRRGVSVGSFFGVVSRILLTDENILPFTLRTRAIDDSRPKFQANRAVRCDV